MKYTTYSLLLLAFVFGCTPKVSNTVKVDEPQVQSPVTTPPEEKGPCITLDDLSPALRNETETAFVLYRDYLKAENFGESFSYWQKAYYTAPAANGSIKYHFDDGIKLYKNLYENTTDPALKSSYADSVSSIYAQRIKCFGEEAYVLGRKAFDLYYYFPGAVSDDELYSMFKQVFDMKGEDTDYYVINPFSKMLYDRAVSGEITADEAGKYAKLVLAAVQKGLGNCSKDCESWNIVNDYAPALLENLEGIKGVYDCNYYTTKYYALFKANPTDCETINEAYRRLKWGECEDSNPQLAEIAAAKKQLCTVAVAVEVGPLRQAFDEYEKGNYSTAAKMFEDFANGTTDIDKKAKYLLLVAKIYYGDIKNFSQARKYAEQAAEVKPNWGDPYILIGKLYASSGPLCGPGRGWDSQVVTWPAIDMFIKAKTIDPSVASEANTFINRYSQYMPTKGDVFQRSLKAGDTFKVGCWINRSTIIRTAD